MDPSGRPVRPARGADGKPVSRRVDHYSSAKIKSSIKAFALGKAISAPLTFLLILLLAAVMPRSEYAAYVAGTAVLEIGIIIGTCGLDWFIQTSITRINVNGTRRQLRRAILLLNGIATVPYLVLGLCGWLLSSHLSAAMSGVVSPAVIELYALVLIVEGPTRMMRDQMLSALLKQRAVQISQIVRTAAVFGGIGLMALGGHVVTAQQAATLEIVAAIFAMAIAACALIDFLMSIKVSPDSDNDLSTWFNATSYRLAASAYGSFLLMVMTGTEITTALVARYLGADATAAFGFVARLMETSRKYLPMDMFYGVLRPATIGRFEGAGRDFKMLMADVNRMLDANLVVLGAGLAIAIAAGDELVKVMSNHNVTSPIWLFATLLLLLIGHSVRRGIELICYTVGHSTVYLRGALSCLLIPPLLVTLLPLTGQPHAAPLVVCVVDVLFVSLVVKGLRSADLPVHFDLSRWLRLAGCTVVAGALGWLFEQAWTGLPGMIGAIVLSAIIFAGLVFTTKVFGRDDLGWASSIMRRRVPNGA